MNIEQIIILQELILAEFENIREDGKFEDELIASSYVQLLAARYSLAGYQLKQDHPELFKGKRTSEDRRKYMRDYMRKYKVNKDE